MIPIFLILTAQYPQIAPIIIELMMATQIIQSLEFGFIKTSIKTHFC